jgi:sugar phosphate isomerase/epimerase
LQPGVWAKDITLYMLGRFGAEGLNYRAIEYVGSAVSAMEIDDRMTLANHAAELGAKTISTEPGGEVAEGQTYAQATDIFYDEIMPVLDVAAEVGVTLLIEPEPGLLIEKFGQYLEFAERVNHPALGLNFDIGHAYCVSEDPAEWVPIMKPHTKHYHFEDIAATRVHHHLVPGDGAIDFDGVFRAIAEHTPDIWVTVELYPNRAKPDEAAKAAREYLQASAGRAGVAIG